MDATKVEARMRQSPRDFRLQQDRHPHPARVELKPGLLHRFALPTQLFISIINSCRDRAVCCYETRWQQVLDPHNRPMKLNMARFPEPSLIAPSIFISLTSCLFFFLSSIHVPLSIIFQHGSFHPRLHCLGRQNPCRPVLGVSREPRHQSCSTILTNPFFV